MSDGSFYHLDIVDTSGDKKYLDVLTSFIKDSNVIIIMYDMVYIFLFSYSLIKINLNHPK